jgi:hypothetical protein
MTEQNPNGPDNEETPISAQPRQGDIEGEGSYTAGREFNLNQTQFVSENKDEIDDKAREAADAVDDPEESAELSEAEDESRERGEGMGEV